jgi:Protein of unknown function (DUF2442)
MPSQAAAEADQTLGIAPAAPWRVKALAILPGYRLAVTFQDGTSGIVDLSALTSAQECGIYEALKEPAIFGQARLELGVVIWPNGAHLDPAWMYEQVKQTKTWSVLVCPLLTPETVYGDGVNVAARLQALAEPAGICISGAVHRLVRGKLDLGYEFAGRQSVRMRRLAVSLGLSILLAVLDLTGSLAAQSPHCDQDLNPAATNPLAYRLRGDRCEGIYIQDVVATALRLVSFTDSYESFDPALDRPLVLEWTSPGNAAVHIRGQSLRNRLYYRMDSDRPAGSASFTWPADVLAALRLGKSELGVLAWTTRRIGSAERPVFEPVRVRQRAAATPGAYRVVVVPGVQVDEIFVSVASLKPNGDTGAYTIDKRPAALGYYPPGRAVVIDVPAPSAAGVYRIDLGATLTQGGTSAMTAYFSRP